MSEHRNIRPAGTTPIDYLGPHRAAVEAPATGSSLERHVVRLLDAAPVLRHLDLDTGGFDLLPLSPGTAAAVTPAGCAEAVAARAGVPDCFVYATRPAGSAGAWPFVSRPGLAHVGPPPSLAAQLAAAQGLGGNAGRHQHFALFELTLPRAGGGALPLAWVHGQTIRPHELGPLWLPGGQPEQPLVGCRHGPSHVWFRLSALAPDQALLRRTFDSRSDGRSRWSIGCALDPTLAEHPQMLLLARFD